MAVGIDQQSFFIPSLRGAVISAALLREGSKVVRNASPQVQTSLLAGPRSGPF